MGAQDQSAVVGLHGRGRQAEIQKGNGFRGLNDFSAGLQGKVGESKIKGTTAGVLERHIQKRAAGMQDGFSKALGQQIGRASCRERV